MFCSLAQGIGVADYPFNKVRPIEYPTDTITENRYISHNYGEYRSSSYFHDGVDMRIFDWETHSKIYPIASGTAYVYPDPTKHVARSIIPAAEFGTVQKLFVDPTQSTLVFQPNTTNASIENCAVSDALKKTLMNGLIGGKRGWGNCVIVDHGTYQTRYAHLSKIFMSSGQHVSINDELGLSGNTGASDAEHLHFSIGNNRLTRNDLAPINTENPIQAGLIQPKYGVLKIKPDPKGFKIRLLATGSDETFGGSNEVIYSDKNDVINIPKPGALLKAVVSGYHMIGRNNKTRSVPYKIEFEIKKIKGPNDFPTLTQSIIFDAKANMNVRGDVYNFSRPYTTTASTEDYYGVKFSPTAGEYIINAKIYSCYRTGPGDAGFHLSEPVIAQREITVGLNGNKTSDLDWYDPSISYAWLPADIADKGIMLASTTFAPSGGIRAAAAEAPQPPEVFYAYANNNVISNNLIDVDPSFQQKAIIEARTRGKSDWSIQIFNEADSKVDEIKVKGQDWLRTEWGGKGSEGLFSFTVTASNSAGITTYESYDTIIIDNKVPSAYISMATNTISTAEQTISASFRPSEDLSSLLVNVVKDRDYSVVEDNIYSTPYSEKDKEETVEWEDAIAFPDGFYRLQYVMTDVAGNIAKAYSPVVSVNKSGDYTAPSITIEVSEPALPELPKWEDRPRVSDIAFDHSGNQYVLYGRYNKLVKYDPSGNIIKAITGVGTSEFRLPLGLAVSPSGDRIYVADTYANRVLIYDQNLAPIKEIKGKYVYQELHKAKHHDEYCIIVRSGDVYPEYSSYHDREGFDLPSDVKITASGDIYVIDENKNRLLKFNRDGETSIFPQKVADFTSEVQKMWDDGVIIGVPYGASDVGLTLIRKNDFWIARKYDYYNVYSNSLNDALSFYRGEMPSFYHVGSGGLFSRPLGVTADLAGGLCLSDTGNNRIQKFNPDGSFAAKFGEAILRSPKGIDVDSFGNVWVADTGNQRIAEFDSAGNYLRDYRTEEYSINPLKLKVREGKIFIADADHNQPLIWSIGGELSDITAPSKWASALANPLIFDYSLTQPAAITVKLIPKRLAASAGESLSEYTIIQGERGAGDREETWNGKISVVSASSASGSSEAAIPEGQYILKVSAVFGDYVKSKTIDINIDNTAPTISLDRAPPAVSPNNDGINDKLTIHSAFSDNLSPTLEATLTLWKDGHRVSTLDYSKAGQNDTRDITWLGKIGGYVLEGNYTLEATVADLAGNSVTTSETVLVDAQPPRIENVKLSNPYFSPNGDSRKDNTEISFHLSDNYAVNMPVTIIAVDKEDKETAVIAQDIELEPGEHSITWEGSISPLHVSGEGGRLVSAGEVLPDGSYYIRLTASDTAGNIGTCEPQTVVVDTVPPSIESFAASPNPFSPNNDGIKDKTYFSYALSEPCNTELNIFRDNGAILFRDYRQYDVTKGGYKWDGAGFHGEILGEEHPYSLIAEDRAGNITSSEAATVVVEYSPSLVPFAFAEPDPFSPVNPKNDFSEIKYYLSRNGLTVTVEVVGKEGRLVKKLVDGAVQDKGDHSVKWLGDFGPAYDGPKAANDKSKVADGAWEFRVAASASDEVNPAITSNTVLVDNVPPNIIAGPVAVDSIKKTASIKYSIPETASVETAVYDVNDNLVAELENSIAKKPGIYTIVYQPETPAKEERYIKISAIDKAFNQAERKSELFSVLPINDLRVAAHSATPATFTPNGDSRSDQTRISYKLSGGVEPYTVSVNILSQSGATVKRLADNESQSGGTWSFIWDGLNDAKQLAPDGNYEYQISATDPLGAKTESRGSILAVSSKPSINLSISPAIFSPNGDNSKDTVTFNYSVNYPTLYLTGEALVKIEIINSSGEAVWSQVFNRTPGSYVYEFDGLLTGNRQLATGNYTVRLSAEDPLGTAAIPVTANLAVDYSQPTISNLSVEPAIFSPQPNGVNDQVVISHALAKQSYVTVKIKQGDTIIRTLEADKLTEAYVPASGLSAKKVKTMGIPTHIWDGTLDSGLATRDGTYTIEISVIDAAGNTHKTEKTVEVDNTLPPVPVVDTLPGYTNEAACLITGAGEIGSAIIVYDNDSSADSGSVDSLGRFSVSINLSGGTNEVKAKSQDVAGNITDYSAVQTVNYETDAPIVSDLQVPLNPAKVGTFTLTFEVSETLEANPIVRINQETATFSRRFPTSNDLNYEYSYNVTSADQQGLASITIEATDLANNLTIYQSNNLLTIDTILPEKPILSLLPANTNQQEKVVTGEAEANSKIKIYRNGALAGETTAGGNGLFSQQIELELGSNAIYATATDSASNESVSNESQVVIFDTQNPVFSSVNINPNPARAGPAAITFVSSKTLEANPLVTVNNNSVSFGSLNNLTYTYNYNVTNAETQGTATIQIQGIDLAGNSGSKTSNFVVDTIYPVVSNLSVSPNPAKAGSLTMTFEVPETLEADPVVKVNGELAAKVPGTENLFSGSWRYVYAYNITNFDQQGPAIISIEATDLAFNITQSVSNNLLTIDTLAPAKPVLATLPQFTNSDSIIVAGTAEPGSNVKIYKNGLQVSKGNAGSDESFSQTIALSIGNNSIYATATDAAGNVSVQSDSQTVILDQTPPSISNVDINPQYAKLGSKVTIDFSASETLLDDPIVKVGGNSATKESKIIYSSSRIDYSYSYTITGTDPDGATPVTIEATDLAGNTDSFTTSAVEGLIVDKTSPEVSNLSVSPNPASIPEVSGQVSIKFNVSEPLKEAPKVYVTQNEAAPQQLVTSGQWQVANGRCEAKYDVVSGYDGPALITIEVTDLAGNIELRTWNILTIDTTKPVISNIASSIGSNPEFTKFAKEGSEVTIRFQSSENLKFNPDVKVNGNSAAYDSLNLGEYTYKYPITNSDINGNATVSISGFDFANNEGTAETSTSAESFVIDLVKPTVVISSDPGMIAEPSPFSTNASSEVGHRQTRLRYETSEYGQVSVKIHKVPNSQTVYVRSDFNDNNLVASFDDGWRSGGEHYRVWDGTIQANQSAYDLNGNGFADPGKYAFIVEVKDRAGNVIEGKWGGTCWIQDNVLSLGQPDAVEIGGDNPRPKFFSPNGDGSLDTTTVWFRVKLGVAPAEPLLPERIGVLAIPDDFKWVGDKKLIGTYTVRVWDESKTTLIRTVAKDAPLDSNTIIYEVWDGKNGTGADKLTPGSYVTDGNYKIEIDARDYIGGQAENNLLTMTVTVDNNPPRIVNSEPTTLPTTPWSNSGKSYNVDLYDDHNAYASKLRYAHYTVYTASNQTGTRQIGWTTIFPDELNANSFTTDWGSDIFGLCGEGGYYVSVSAVDYAGNSIAQNDVFFVKKDTANPYFNSIGFSGAQPSTWTNNFNTTCNFSGADASSGVSRYIGYVDGEYWGKNDRDSGTDPGTYLIGSPWSFQLPEGIHTVQLRVDDNVGQNVSSSIYTFYVDSQAPVVTMPGELTFNPYTNGSVTANFTASDPGQSGFSLSARIIYTGRTVKSLSVINDGNSNYHITWNGTNDNNDYENDGDYGLEVTASDGAGNSTTKYSSIGLRDDQRITNNASDSSSPYLFAGQGNNLNLQWIEGGADDSRAVMADAAVSTGWVAAKDDLAANAAFYIDHRQMVIVYCRADGEYIERHRIYTNLNQLVWSEPNGTGGGEETHLVYLGIGSYYANVSLDFRFGSGSGYTKVNYIDRKFSQYSSAGSNFGQSWGSILGPQIVDGPTGGITTSGVHSVKAESSKIWYKRGSSAWVNITNAVPVYGGGTRSAPTVTADNNGNAYVAWEDTRDNPAGGREIYFQKIPSNFARITGSVQGAVIKAETQPVIVSMSATIETPLLITPADKKENVSSLRPTFEWKHRKGNATQYNIDIAKNDTFSIAHQTFNKSANAGSPDKTDATLYYFNYAIHEFDPGLDKDTYYWKVTALSTNEAATSEVWSFTIAPDLTLTDITNYPNPFNPNREKTKLRYRLSTDASEVKIRIYDVTGALVTELDGTTAGEASSIWGKYNDVEWDGRNGRGDIVMNGIYPFEVTARLGDRSVSGRGKIAVLK